MISLASDYMSQAQLGEAEELELPEIERSRRLLRDRHPDTLTSMNGLVLAFKLQNRNDGAVLLMAECVLLRAHVLGPYHPCTNSTLETLYVREPEKSKYSSLFFGSTSLPQLMG